MKIFELLLENYKTVRNKWIKSGSDADDVDHAISQYRELANLDRISGNQKNIDWWSKTPFAEFKSFVDAQLLSPSITQVKRKKVVGRSITVKENNEWLIVVPLDRDASCFHGKNTDWCVSKQKLGHFEDFFYDQKNILIFCINKITNGLWALASGDPDVFTIWDQQDNVISPESFTKQTGINPFDLVKEVYQEHGKQIQSELDSIDQANRYVSWWMHNVTPHERDKKIEDALMRLNHINWAVQYIIKIGKNVGPQHFPEKLTRILFDTAIDSDFDWEEQHANQVRQAIKYIKDPSDSLQLMMVELVPASIEDLPDPPLKVQMWLVNHYPELFFKIENQKEQAQLAAIKFLEKPEKSIKNPTEKVKIELVKKRPFSIGSMDNPSDIIKTTAVKSNGYAVTLIKNPSQELWRLALETTPQVIEKYPNAPVALQLLAVKANPDVVQRIKPSASKQAQLAAVEKNPSLVWGIQNKFPETLELARKKGVDI